MISWACAVPHWTRRRGLGIIARRGIKRPHHGPLAGPPSFAPFPDLPTPAIGGPGTALSRGSPHWSPSRPDGCSGSAVASLSRQRPGGRCWRCRECWAVLPEGPPLPGYHIMDCVFLGRAGGVGSWQLASSAYACVLGRTIASGGVLSSLARIRDPHLHCIQLLRGRAAYVLCTSDPVRWSFMRLGRMAMRR